MRFRFQLIALILALAVSSVAFANSTTHELTGGAGSTLQIPTATGSNMTFGLSGGYNWQFMDMLQLGGSANFSTTKNLTTLGILVGPTFNLMGKDLMHAMYVSAQAGISMASVAGTSNTDFAYAGAVGRRYPIVGSVTWKPEVNVAGTTATGSKPQINVVPAQFAFFF